MFEAQPIRIKRALKHAKHLHRDLADQTPNPAIGNQVLDQLKPTTIRRVDDGRVVTEIGFVTMALIPNLAKPVADAYAVPGTDDQATRGHLVIRTGHVPFHSLQGCPDAAVAEAMAAHERSNGLVKAYGGRQALRNAAGSAPWHLRSMPVDIDNAGLCQWGAISFLKRIGMHSIAMKYGLPRFVLRLAGAYGDRMTATTLLRHQASMNQPNIQRQELL